MEITRWIFIGIGFGGTLFLAITAIINFVMCIKNKSFGHLVLKVQIVFMVANLLFVAYGLGLSICNYGTDLSQRSAFWNSVPTWAGNLIPFILNLIMVIGKIIENKKTKGKKSSLMN